MPKHQGALDGLCGVYAIINAFEECGLSDDGDLHEELFETCCLAMTASSWPRVLWEGTSIGNLRSMIKLCRKKIPAAAEVKVTFPFIRKPPESNKEYWARFDELLLEEEGQIRCAIVRMTHPWSHWIVAAHHGGRIWFTDSTAGRPDLRKNRQSVFAGERNGNKNIWLIDRKDFLLFSSDR